MHFTSFCHAINVFMHYLTRKWIEIQLQKDITPLLLFEEDDNEVT